MSPAGGDGLGPVVITPRDIYDQLIQLRSGVERLIAAEADIGRLIGDHEARLRDLERARWPLPSLAALLALIALVVPYIRE